MQDGDVIDSAGLASAVKTFFRDNALPKKVRLGVANQQIAVRHMELPKIADAEELAAAVRFQAGDAIAMPLGRGGARLPGRRARASAPKARRA